MTGKVIKHNDGSIGAVIEDTLSYKDSKPIITQLIMILREADVLLCKIDAITAERDKAYNLLRELLNLGGPPIERNRSMWMQTRVKAYRELNKLKEQDSE